MKTQVKTFEELQELLSSHKNGKDTVFMIEGRCITPIDRKDFYLQFLYRSVICSPEGTKPRYYVEELNIEDPHDSQIASKCDFLIGRNKEYFFSDMEELEKLVPSPIVYCISENDLYYHKEERNIADRLFTEKQAAIEYMWENFIIPELDNDDQVPFAFSTPDDVIEYLEASKIDIKEYMWENFIIPELDNDDQVPFAFITPDDVIEYLEANKIDIKEITVDLERETTQNQAS